MRLDLGCGDRPYEEDNLEWSHMDERNLPHVEIIGDVSRLSAYISPASLEEIMARHILEHFSHLDTTRILLEWRDCLVDGGRINIEVPNLLWQMRAAVFGHPDPQGRSYTTSEIIELMFGGQDYPGNYHKTGFTPNSLHKALESAGYKSVDVDDIGMVLIAKAEK